MAENSKIQWTTHTLNLWWGCTKVHSGCDNCYAEVLSKRFGDNVWGNDNPRREIKSAFKDLGKYQRKAQQLNEHHTVFVGSMMDIFEKPMELIGKNYSTGGLRNALFDRIIRNDYPNLIFLFLTKRPSNINKYIPTEWKINPPTNVWFGTSPVNQETFDTLIPQLLQVKGNKFLSIEPQLDAITIKKFGVENSIGWIIQGGESGGNKRPFNLDWAYSLKQECSDLEIPYFFKQIDKVKQVPSDLFITQTPFK